MKVPHPIPYQGSKRHLAPSILRFFPDDVSTLFEPFAGSAAVTIATASRALARRYVLNDLNEPLVCLWRDIIERPSETALHYSELWLAQNGREKIYYDFVRSEFNLTKRTDLLLYLLARCVKAAVRYNSNGEFNQSPDNRRKGMHPETMATHILNVSHLLKGKTVCSSVDFTVAVESAGEHDLVYLDPPYQGVCGKRDPRYLDGVSFDAFAETLNEMNSRKISYIVSYDGRTGGKTFGKPLPASLHLQHFELPAGKSSQATLLGRNEDTYESLYISSALSERLSTPVMIRRPEAAMAARMEALF